MIGGISSPNQNDVVFRCVVEITSPHYWVVPISEDQRKKYEIIEKMREKGYKFREISDYLNNSSHRPQRTSCFTPEQVFGLYSKMNKRIKRLGVVTPPKILEIGFQTIPKNQEIVKSLKN